MPLMPVATLWRHPQAKSCTPAWGRRCRVACMTCMGGQLVTRCARCARTGWTRWRRCGGRASTCARAASSAWGRAPRTAWACCTSWPRCASTPRACPSTPWWRSPVRPSLPRARAALTLLPAVTAARAARRAPQGVVASMRSLLHGEHLLWHQAPALGAMRRPGFQPRVRVGQGPKVRTLTSTDAQRCAGTPLEGQEPASAVDMVRTIATARIVMPRTVVRLSAGRLSLSLTDQARSLRNAHAQPTRVAPACGLQQGSGPAHGAVSGLIMHQVRPAPGLVPHSQTHWAGSAMRTQPSTAGRTAMRCPLRAAVCTLTCGCCPGDVLPGGRQLHLRRGQAADDAQQRAQRRPAGGPGPPLPALQAAVLNARMDAPGAALPGFWQLQHGAQPALQQGRSRCTATGPMP